MLPTLIHRYDKNHFMWLSDATFYNRIKSIYQFVNLSWMKKISIFEEYGAFNSCLYMSRLNDFIRLKSSKFRLRSVMVAYLYCIL